MSCGKCNEKISREESEVVNCGACRRIFHCDCEGISGKDFESYKNLSPAQRKTWKCNGCSLLKQALMRSASVSSQDDPRPQFGALMDKLDAFNNRFSGVEKAMEILPRIEIFMEKCEGIFASLSSDVKELRQEINELHKENNGLKQRVAQLERAPTGERPCDERAVELHGIPPLNGEDVFDAAEGVLKKTLGCTVEKRDIDDCFYIKLRSPSRAASSSVAGGQNHQVISADSGAEPVGPGILVVKFTTKRMKELTIRAWRGRRSSREGFCLDGTPLRRFKVTERLSGSARVLLRETREAARRSGWRFVWTSEGKVLARKSEGMKVFVVNSSNDLKHIN